MNCKSVHNFTLMILSSIKLHKVSFNLFCKIISFSVAHSHVTLTTNADWRVKNINNYGKSKLLLLRLFNLGKKNVHLYFSYK